jgi:membrane associated rhomboid family serine protease
MVYALIAVNVAIYALTAAQAGGADVASAPLFQAWSLYPPAIAAGQWWRLVTAGFLHFGPLHIGFNMLALWVIGKDFERVVGRGRFLAVYLVGLLGGSASAFVFGVPRAEVAGASGAVFGLMGGLAVLLRRLNLPPGPAVSMIVINLVISFVVPGISVLGHLGGLVVGAVAAAAMVYAPARRGVAWQSATIALLIVLLVLVMAARAVTFGA